MLDLLKNDDGELLAKINKRAFFHNSNEQETDIVNTSKFFANPGEKIQTAYGQRSRS